MPNIRIKRRHDMPRDEVKRHVDRLADDLKERLQAECRWQGDSLCFTRSGASGQIDVTDDSVTVDVKLGLLLAPFKDSVETAVREYLDENLA